MKFIDWTLKSAKEYVGGLAKPSKMPGFSYSLPAQECNVGSQLRENPDSTCSGCYALKGNYVRFPNVGKALYKRLECITKEHWVSAMSFLISHYGKQGHNYFRWHDSGDLQDMNHFLNILDICSNTPKVSHWLPTREYGLLKEFKASNGQIPSNLNVRVSAPMVDKYPTVWIDRGFTLSGVHTWNNKEKRFTCPAPKQDNECKQCRACWNPKVKTVSYHVH